MCTKIRSIRYNLVLNNSKKRGIMELDVYVKFYRYLKAGASEST